MIPPPPFVVLYQLAGPGVSAAGAAQRPQTGAGRRSGEGVPAQAVQVGVPERGQPGDVGLADRVAALAQRGDGGVEVAGVPQHDGVQDQAEGAELVFLAFPVRLVDLPAAAVEDGAGQLVAGLLHGGLGG
jgi:hypothetical protein